MIVIGDVHGCYETLMALMDKLPDDDVCFVGDLIDRGPASPQVVDFVKSNSFDCTLGNHEDMALDEIRASKHYDNGIWLYNGGVDTIEQYKKADNTWLREHFNWFNELPYYLEYPDIKNDKGESLFISHSAVKPYGPKENYSLYEATHATGPKASYKQINKSIMWYRGTPARLEGKFHIFGHTPVKNPDITDYYANVDTGCVYGGRQRTYNKYKYLTALQFPSMEVFQQEYIG